MSPKKRQVSEKYPSAEELSLGSLVDYVRPHLKLLMVLAVLCLAAYANALDNEFVSDDISSIVELARLGDPLWNLRVYGVFQASKSLIFLLFGRSVVAYHSFNLLLHLLNVWAVYFFLLIVIRNRKLAALTSLLFALHPIATEAVGWISGGGYVLGSLTFLISLFFYDRFLRGRAGRLGPFREWWGILGAWSWYLIGNFSSIWVLPLPVVYFAYEKLVLGRRWREVRWFFYVGCLVVALFSVWSIRPHIEARATALGVSRNLADVTTSIPLALGKDLSLLVWPVPLTLYHEGEISSAWYLFFVRIFSLVFIFGLPLVLRRYRFFLFFWALFLASISFSLSPIQMSWPVAERYLYFGNISFCVLVAYLLLTLEQRFKVRHLAVLILVPILLFYFGRTYLRNEDWQTPERLWFADAKVSPRSPQVHNNLGDVYGRRGDLDRAVKEFELARSLQPRYANATHNLGSIYLQKGDWEKARQYFLEAISYDPNISEPYFNLGAISFNEGNFQQARDYFAKALELSPDDEAAFQGWDLANYYLESSPSATPK